MARVSYEVKNIACEGCANAIRRALGALTGVQHVEVDVSSRQVVVDFDENRTDSEAIGRRIGDAGFREG